MRRHRGWPSASGSEDDLDRVPGLSDESESFRGLAQREDVCDQIRDVDAFLPEEIDRFADVPRAPPVRGRHRDLFPPEGVERNVDLCGRLDRREEYDRPAAIDRSEPLSDRLRSARACDDEVREVPFVRLLHVRWTVFSPVDDDVGPRLPRGGFPNLHNVRRDHLRRAGRLRELDVQESGDTAPEDDYRASRTEAREPLTTNHTGERLDKRGLVIRNFPREREYAMLHVSRGHPDELRKSTGIEVRRTQGLADGLVAREAVPTRTTRYVVRHEDAVADLDGVHAGADLDDLGGDLMPEDERRLRLPVPLHDIGAADAGCFDTDKNLSGPDAGRGQLHDSHVVVRVVHRGAHVPRLLLRPRALEELERFLRGRALMDDGADAADHADRIRRLPDVPAHVHAFRAILDRVVGELERIEFGLELRSSGDDEGDGTRLDDLREIVTVICLHEMRPEFGGDAAGQAEVPRVAPLEFLPDRGHREHRDASLLAFVDEFSEVHEGIVLVGGADEDRQRDGRGVQSDGFLHRGGDLLVR